MTKSVIVNHSISMSKRKKVEVATFNEYGRRNGGTNGMVCRSTAMKFAATQPADIRAEILRQIG